MPITVTAPEGVLTTDGRREILPRLSKALVSASGATGNRFLESFIGGTVHILPTDSIYADGVNTPLVMVEVKLPHIGLPDPASRAAFIADVARIVDELTVEEHRTGRTWVNILNAEDGAWGIGTKSWTDNALVEAIGVGTALTV